MPGIETYSADQLTSRARERRAVEVVIWGHPRRQLRSDVPVATHALIRNMPHSSKSSQSPGLQTNADGSADVYFAPTAPAGKESNWIPTDAKGRFEALFRFYGPEKPLFEKTWVLPDIEKV